MSTDSGIFHWIIKKIRWVLLKLLQSDLIHLITFNFWFLEWIESFTLYSINFLAIKSSTISLIVFETQLSLFFLIFSELATLLTIKLATSILCIHSVFQPWLKLSSGQPKLFWLGSELFPFFETWKKCELQVDLDILPWKSRFRVRVKFWRKNIDH